MDEPVREFDFSTYLILFLYTVGFVWFVGLRKALNKRIEELEREKKQLERERDGNQE